MFPHFKSDTVEHSPQNLQTFKFHMLHMSNVLLSIRQEEWFTTVDLKDVYFHIPIDPCHRQYLYWFVAALLALLQSRGMHILPDWLISGRYGHGHSPAHHQIWMDSLGCICNNIGTSWSWSMPVAWHAKTLFICSVPCVANTLSQESFNDQSLVRWGTLWQCRSAQGPWTPKQ